MTQPDTSTIKQAKPERPWVIIKNVPKHVGNADAQLALAYLIIKADKVEMRQFPKDQSQYRAYFDDGVYQGAFIFQWTENGLNPLRVYEELKTTGWPGYAMGWVRDAARKRMEAEIDSI